MSLTTTRESIAFVAGEARAIVAAHRVGAPGEHIARPVFALVLVWFQEQTSEQKNTKQSQVSQTNKQTKKFKQN